MYYGADSNLFRFLMLSNDNNNFSFVQLALSDMAISYKSYYMLSS